MEEKKVTVYLIRHAQSHANVEASLKENALEAESYLTMHGRIESNLTGLHLSNVKFDMAYTSNFGRAIETTERILGFQGHGALKPVILPELKEVDFGIYGNSSYSEFLRYSVSTGDNPFEWTYPGGDGFPQAGERMLRAFEGIVNECLQNGYKTALILSHSCSICAFMNALLNSQHHHLHRFERSGIKMMNNCNYFILEVTRNDKGVFHETLQEKYRSEHVKCIHPTSKATPLMKLAIRTGKYTNCVQQ